MRKFLMPVFIGMAVSVSAQKTFTGSTDNNWSISTNWNPVGTPAPGDDVIIPSGYNIIVDTNASCKTIVFGNTSDVSSSLTISSTFSLVVTHSVNLTDPFGSNGDQVLSIGAGILTCDSLIMANTTSASEDLEVNLSTGTLTVSSQLMMNGAVNENLLAISGSGKLQIGGSINTGGDITMATAATVEYYASGDQNIRAMTYGGSLIVSNGGTKILTGSTTLAGGTSLEIKTNTTLNYSQYSFTVGGQSIIRGTLLDDNTGGTNTFQDSVTIVSGGTWNSTVSESFTFLKGLCNNGTFTSGLGTYTFSSNNQYIGGSSPITISGTLSVPSAITLYNTGTLSIGGNLDAASASWVNHVNSALTFNNTSISIGSVNFSAAGNTVTYNNTSTTTLIVTTFHHLVKNGTGILNSDSGVIVNGNITVNAGTLVCRHTIEANGSGLLTVANGATLTLGQTTSGTNVSFPANITDGNITLGSSSTVIYNNDSSQTFNDGISYGHLTINTGSSLKVINLSTFFNVSGNLILSFGVTLNASDYTVDIDGNISGTGSLTFTTGNLFLAGSYSNGTFTAGNGTVTYNGASQTVRGTTYNNLTLAGSGTKTPGQAITVNRHLIIQNNTTLAISTDNFSVFGITTIDGSLTETSTNGTNNLDTVIINGTWNCTVAEAFTINGTLTNTGSFTSGNGTYTFATTGTKTLAGTMLFAGNVAINNGVVLQNADSITINGNLTGGNSASAWQNLSGAYLSVGGTILTTGTLTANANPNTVEYSGSADQTIKATTYHHLYKSGNSTANAGSGITVNGNIRIFSGTLACLNTITATMSGQLRVDANATLTLGQTSSATDVLFPSNITNANIILDSLSTVNFNTNGTQTFNGMPTYGNLGISSGSSSKTIALAANLGIRNNLTLTQAAGTVTLSASTFEVDLNGNITGNGTFTFSTGTLKLGGNSHLFTGTLTPGDLVTLDGAAAQTIAGNAYKNLKLNNAAGASLNSATTISHTLEVVSGILAAGSNLTLLSIASQTAAVSGPAAGGYITGNVTVQRFIPSVARRWRFLSSPVNGATLSDWKNEIYITGTSKAAGGFDTALTTKESVFWYDESVTTGDMKDGWTEPSNISHSLVSGRGYRVFIRGDRTPGRLDGSVSIQNAVTLTLTGPLNTGNVSMLVSFTSSGKVANDGWNLLGNPYASAIDWNAFHDAGRSGTSPDYSGTSYTHLDAIAYIYDPNTHNFAAYNAFSNSGTGAFSTGIIPSGAAFFVKATTPSPSATFGESHKTGTTPSAVFKTLDDDKLRLKLSADSINTDEMLLCYHQNALPSFDAFDIPDLMLSEINVSSYTSGQLLAADFKPQLPETDTTWLAVSVNKKGTYTFSIHKPTNFANGRFLYFIDRTANTITTIESETELAFYTENAFSDNSRFFIVSSASPVNTSLNETSHSFPRTYLYPAITSGKVTVNCPLQAGTHYTVTIRDMQGHSHCTQVYTENQAELDFSPLSAGIYLVQLECQGTLHTLKCIKQ